MFEMILAKMIVIVIVIVIVMTIATELVLVPDNRKKLKQTHHMQTNP